ncbi:uncharacterized protein LOC18427146 [Amborella trichopoda]|uniref:Uncharacterized protein n=1 Tax=Amborella trichopoda TaxID=13333 RepID=W1NU52_AMBTC|nr:uncharacterized protein LOC18427146 [Amborella trichopoda]ERM99117.1 hypothetical protein AMTR_s00101p00143980 [Amborella trichopoda]|eukprot:XP_006836264.1 uncharacterized protein LOC18427146 [Amborella trichopoda]
MDEAEFRQLLHMFPVVRSRTYCADTDASRQISSQTEKDEIMEWQDAWAELDMKGNKVQAIDLEDPFWEKLRLAAEKKMNAADAEKFCKAFQSVYKRLVYEAMTPDCISRIASMRVSPTN